MAGVIVEPELIPNDFAYALERPEAVCESGFLGPRFQDRFQSAQIGRAQSGLPPRSAGLLQHRRGTMLANPI